MSSVQVEIVAGVIDQRRLSGHRGGAKAATNDHDAEDAIEKGF